MLTMLPWQPFAVVHAGLYYCISDLQRQAYMLIVYSRFGCPQF